MKTSLTIIACLGLLGGCSEKQGAPAPVSPAPDRPAAAARAPAPVPEPAPSPAPASTPAPITLTAESIGPVRFGMTLAEAEAAVKEKAGGKPTPDCTYVRFKALPDVHLMVENGLVMRADIKGSVANTTGFKAGDDPGAVRARYPNAGISPHKYVEGGHDIRIPAKGDAALIFEDDGKKITSVRGGKEPNVSYVEGCS